MTKQAHQSWKRSSHAEVPCYRCHLDPSPGPLLDQIFRQQSNHLVRTLSGDYETPVNAKSRYSQQVANARCLPCHPRSDLKSKTGAKLLRSRHAKHIDAGTLCTDCHNRTAHDDAKDTFAPRDRQKQAGYRDFLEMRTGCWRCHSKNRQWRDDRALDRLNLYSFPPTACVTCHEGRRRPMTGELSHRDRLGQKWSDGRHGRAARRNYDACSPCHPSKSGDRQAADCTECHGGVTMPHDADSLRTPSATTTKKPLWIRAHSAEDSRPCAICHDASGSDDLCDTCHHGQFLEPSGSFGPWSSSHQKIARLDGTSSCVDCHMTEFCSYCHTQGKKPPAGAFMFRNKAPRMRGS